MCRIVLHDFNPSPILITSTTDNGPARMQDQRKQTNMKAFTTSYVRTIPASTMRTVCERMKSGHDWQTIETEELRKHIPEHDDDLDESNECLYEAQDRNEDAALESAPDREETFREDVIHGESVWGF